MARLEKELCLLDKASQHFSSSENIIRILQRCRTIKNHESAQRFQAFIRRNGLQIDSPVWPYLVPMLVEGGHMNDAQTIFDRLPQRNEDLWNTLIAGYAKHGSVNEAFVQYQKMKEDSVQPSSHTFVPLLNACAKMKDAKIGQEMHLEILRKGFETHIHIGSTLIDMYVKCDLIGIAQEVFDKLPVQNVIAWNSLITGYARNGSAGVVLNCFEQMQVDGISPTAITYVCALKACGSIGALEKGNNIHSELSRKNLCKELFVGSALVDMYANCGLILKAREAFEKMMVRDIVSWTSVIGGYSKNGYGEEALHGFQQMQLEGFLPNTHTFVCSLKACGLVGAISRGQQIHAVISAENLERDPFVGSTLVDMYAINGYFRQSQEVFNILQGREITAWNALITGYANHGFGTEALNCYDSMKLEKISPNKVTFLSSLKACTSIRAVEKGQEIHADIEKSGLAIDFILGSALVDMYGSCGFLPKAQEAFDNISTRNVVAWNALITGYIKHGALLEALDCFEQMKADNVSPDLVTYVSCLKACGRLGILEKGWQIHAAVRMKGLEKDVFVGSTLVDMYSNCGAPEKAREVFDILENRDVATWNALLAGYAQLGESDTTFSIFHRMIMEGQVPSLVTLVSIINSCSHAGLVEIGQMYLATMNAEYGLVPSLEHHNCVVDLLGRSGRLKQAVLLTELMPFLPNLIVWHTVLSACRKWSDVELGILAFEYAVELDEKDMSTYFYITNIFLDANMLDDAERLQLENSADRSMLIP